MKNFESAHAHGEPVVINFYDAGVVTDAKITEVAFKPGKVLYDAEIQVKNGMKTRIHGIDSAFVSKPNAKLVKKTSDEFDDGLSFSITEIEKILDHERLNHGSDPLTSINRIYRKMIALKENARVTANISKDDFFDLHKTYGIDAAAELEKIMINESNRRSQSDKEFVDTVRQNDEKLKKDYPEFNYEEEENPFGINLFKKPPTPYKVQRDYKESIIEQARSMSTDETGKTVAEKSEHEKIQESFNKLKSDLHKGSYETMMRQIARAERESEVKEEFVEKNPTMHVYYPLNNSLILKKVLPNADPSCTVLMTNLPCVAFNPKTNLPQDLSYCPDEQCVIYEAETMPVTFLQQFVEKMKLKMILFICDENMDIVRDNKFQVGTSISPMVKLIAIRNVR